MDKIVYTNEVIFYILVIEGKKNKIKTNDYK